MILQMKQKTRFLKIGPCIHSLVVWICSLHGSNCWLHLKSQLHKSTNTSVIYLEIWDNKIFYFILQPLHLTQLSETLLDADRSVPAQPLKYRDKYNYRKISELPYHLFHAQNVKELIQVSTEKLHVTFVIKQILYLQNVQVTKVTLGILFWMIDENSGQVWGNSAVVIFVYWSF